MAILDYFLNENTNVLANTSGIVDLTGFEFKLDWDHTGSPTIQDFADIDVSPQSKVWASFSARCNSNINWLSSYDNFDFFEIRNGSEVLFALRCVTNGSFSVKDYCQADGEPVLTDISKTLSNSHQRFDIEFLSGSAGVIRVYLDGVLVFEREGDTQKNSADQQITQLGLLPIHNNSTDMYYKNFFVCDGDTPSLGIEMTHAAVTGVGQHNDFKGDYANVVKTAIDDSTYMQGGASQKQSFQIEAPASEYDGRNLLAMSVYMRNQADAKGEMQTKPLICSATSANEVVGSKSSTNKVYPEPLREIFHTAPDGTAWDRTKLVDTEIGMINIPAGIQLISLLVADSDGTGWTMDGITVETTSNRNANTKQIDPYWGQYMFRASEQAVCTGEITIDVSAYAVQIDAELAAFDFVGAVASDYTDSDYGRFELMFLDEFSEQISQTTGSNLSPSSGQANWTEEQLADSVPIGTRFIKLTLYGYRNQDDILSVFWDINRLNLQIPTES